MAQSSTAQRAAFRYLTPACLLLRPSAARAQNRTDPIYLIALFFSSGTPTRMLICLVVHPLLLEAAEAAGRGTKGDAVARKLRAGEFKTFEEAAERVIDKSLKDAALKYVMMLY